MDLQELLSLVNSDLKGKASFSADVYRDEPIVRPANKLENFVPDKIAALLSLMKKRDFLAMSKGKAFKTAGIFMKDYTDDYDKKSSFFCYYPTYSDMNREQLRTYFTWRTKVREGNVEYTSLSYAFVYVYELINLIGVRNAEEGFFALKQFMLDYSVYEPKITYYYKKWLTEFAVYYDLPNEHLKNICICENDEALYLLINCENKNDDELFPALLKLSSYNIESSALFKEHGEDMKKAVCAVYREWSDHYRKNRTRTLSEKLFGVGLKRNYNFFDNAVFYDENNDTDRIYHVSPLHFYERKNGKWQIENFPAGIKKNSELGAVMRETDRVLRRELCFKKQLKVGNVSKTVEKIIETEIKKLIEDKKNNARKEIVIDTSYLDSIRRDADITRDRLITEEEKKDILSAEVSLPNELECLENESKKSEDSLLDDTEKAFLSLLLSCGDVKKFGRENGVMLSMLSDSINEKLFDLFGDTVIGFDGDIPRIIEDYTDEIKELL